MPNETEKSTFKFLKKALESLPAPKNGKRSYYWDTEVRGLCLDVTSKGHKTFYYRRTVNYKRQQVLIGRFPEITIEEARAKSLELGSQIAKGADPTRMKQLLREEATFGELLQAYIDGHAKQRCLAWREMEAVFRRYLSDWKEKKLSSMKVSEVQERMNKIALENGKVPANHTLTYARAAINWCINNGLTTHSNPWTSVKKFKTQSRERFLRPDELGKFFACLEKLPNDTGIRDYIYLSLYTGARRSNVLGLRWDQIDFDLGMWRIPRTKSGDSQVLPLTGAALKVLKRRYDERSSEWVFPSDTSASQHLMEPKKGWYALLDTAQIQDLRMHDLRRTLGSYMAIGNQSLHVIGKVLGHKSATATQIYSRLTNDPLLQAMEKAQKDMLVAAKSNTRKRKPRASRKG
jgi:integrase